MLSQGVQLTTLVPLCRILASLLFHASRSFHFYHWLKSYVFLAFFSLLILKVNMHPVSCVLKFMYGYIYIKDMTLNSVSLFIS